MRPVDDDSPKRKPRLVKDLPPGAKVRRGPGGLQHHKPDCKCVGCNPNQPKKRATGPRKPPPPPRINLGIDGEVSRLQENFIAAYADPQSPTYKQRKGSMLVAGYAPTTAASGAHHNPLKSNKVQMALRKAFEEYGVSSQKLASVVAAGLDATRTEYFAHQGIVTDERTIVDWKTRHAFTETALRARGDFPRETGDNNVALIIRVPSSVASPDEWEREVRESITVKPQASE